MPQIQKYDLLLLDGGLNESDRPTHIADNEAVLLENFFVRDKKLKVRGGTKRITASPYAEKISGIYPYRTAVGAWTLVVGARQSMAKLVDTFLGKEIQALAHSRGRVYDAYSNPWSFRQYNNVLYGTRKGVAKLQRYDGTYLDDAGIEAPATAPTVVEGAAGDLGPGANAYVVTFVNRRTGAESDFSPASTPVTIGSSKRLALSNIPVSTNGQVDGRNLYRTLVDAQGEYFYETTIEDNNATTYESNAADEDLGDSVSLENGLPPESLLGLELWRERLWGHDGRDLFASRAGYPEQFSGDFVIPISPDDGHEIRGLLAFGNQFLVGKTNLVKYGTGFDVGDFDFNGVLTDKHGVGAGQSMATAEGYAFWLGMDDFYLSDGQSVKGIGTSKVRSTLEAIPSSLRDQAVSYVVPGEGFYVTSIPQDESSGFDVEVIYNYKSNTWHTRKRTLLGAPTFAGEFADENFERILYAAFDSGHLYQLDSGMTDDGEPIVAKVRGKSFGFDGNSVFKYMRRLHVLCPSLVGEELTAKLYRDEGSTPLKTKTFDLNQPRPWKRIGLSSAGEMGATVSVELEYSGDQEFEIDGLSFEIVQTERSSNAI